MTVSYPQNFARFYDLIYHQLRDEQDMQFFQEKIRGCKGKILEAGVGTGRLFIEARKQGADIYGLDVSESMIQILKNKLEPEDQDRISLQNIVDFSYDFQFDLIIAPFRVFMHIIEKQDQIEALNNVHRHLKPGGVFIFDTFVPDLKQLIGGLDNITDFEKEYAPGLQLKRTVSTKPDLINQLIVVSFRLEWEEKSGDKEENWTLPLRFFFRFELEHLIERSAFDDYDMLGDYRGNKLNMDSRDFIALCRKSKE